MEIGCTIHKRKNGINVCIKERKQIDVYNVYYAK